MPRTGLRLVVLYLDSEQEYDAANRVRKVPQTALVVTLLTLKPSHQVALRSVVVTNALVRYLTPVINFILLGAVFQHIQDCHDGTDGEQTHARFTCVVLLAFFYAV